MDSGWKWNLLIGGNTVDIEGKLNEILKRILVLAEKIDSLTK